MKKLLSGLLLLTTMVNAQHKPVLTEAIALKLSQLPLHCIEQEYPNKTAHIINNEKEAMLSPKALHPSFYGCFDWHSSVHGHWMLVKLLKIFPNIKNADEIYQMLDRSFQPENLQEEAAYFSKYALTNTFERTYGWAWLLKLDEELANWNNPSAQKWHKHLKPLTDTIVKLWKTFLPKQTYPNRTGVHPNTAFALAFAIDWARVVRDKSFEEALLNKAKYFYLKDEKTPAYLEPDGSDFFSPSLEIAELMSRVLPQKEFTNWFNKFYEERSIRNIFKIPVISDINDYQTVHLVGLSFSKAWCMKEVARILPTGHPMKNAFKNKSNEFLTKALPLLFKGNYGGDHWLGSFAVYALEK